MRQQAVCWLRNARPDQYSVAVGVDGCATGRRVRTGGASLADTAGHAGTDDHQMAGHFAQGQRAGGIEDALIVDLDAAGVAVPGQKTNIVYTADAVRGVEVFEVTLPTAGK